MPTWKRRVQEPAVNPGSVHMQVQDLGVAGLTSASNGGVQQVAAAQMQHKQLTLLGAYLVDHSQGPFSGPSGSCKQS